GADQEEPEHHHDCQKWQNHADEVSGGRGPRSLSKSRGNEHSGRLLWAAKGGKIGRARFWVQGYIAPNPAIATRSGKPKGPLFLRPSMRPIALLPAPSRFIDRRHAEGPAKR